MNALYQELRNEIDQVAENTDFYGPSPVDNRILEVPFPLNALPQPLAAFAKQVSESKQCPLEFVVLPILSVIASAIGSTRQIELKPDWREWPIIWTCIIGESGSGKTPAFEELIKPIEQIESQFASEIKADIEQYERDKLVYETQLKEWLKNDSEPPPTKPESVAVRCWRISDITIEALAPLLRDNPRGLLLERDEIAGWVASFDQYRSGSKGSDASNWLSLFGGKSIRVDRKSGDLLDRQIRVNNPIVSITGGTQPTILTRFLTSQHRESGLAARFLFVFRNSRTTKWNKENINEELKTQYADLINRLYSFEANSNENRESIPIVVPLSPEAESIWGSFYDSHSEELSKLTGDLCAAWAKLRSYAARIALIIHCVNEATEQSTNDAIDEHTMRSSIRIVEWFKNETSRVYSLFSSSEDELNLHNNADRIRKAGGSMSIREACRTFRMNSSNAEQLLRELIKAGYGEWQTVAEQSSPMGGRPRGQVFELYHNEFDEPENETEDNQFEYTVINPQDIEQIDNWQN